MATVEIRCPKCRSLCSLEDKEIQQYECQRCDTAFSFLEPAKKNNITDALSNDCPDCKNYVKPGNGFVCSECGKTNFCSKCIIEKSEKLICKECLTKNERECDICGKDYVYRCAVCGIKRCIEDYSNFNIEIKDYSRALNKRIKNIYSIYCPSCQSQICDKCYKTKEGLFRGGVSLYCKKCGGKLALGVPHSC
jgi:hypothetical protein